MTVVLKNEIFRQLIKYKKYSDLREAVRRLAKYLVYHLELHEVCKILRENGYKISCREEPWHSRKARDYYLVFLASKQNFGYIAKANSLLKRYGIPYEYYLLAEAIISGKIQL